MQIQTTVDCEVRFVTQYDQSDNCWHYYLNGREVLPIADLNPGELCERLGLPDQQPD
jgi:hypothetical protein